jgi:hypothetical protein
MMIGPAPMMRMEEMSVRLGINCYAFIVYIDCIDDLRMV